MNKDIKDLDSINQYDLKGIYITPPDYTSCTNEHEIFNWIKHILGHQISLNICKSIKVLKP